jgi:murein peptide amidase A
MADYAALAERVQSASQPPVRLRLYGQQVSLDGTERYDLFVATIPSQTRRPRFSVLLNGGTHGDEPAGAEAVVRFLETRRYAQWPEVAFTLTPCTNPWGYVHGKREGPGGRDLNRAFQRATRLTAQITLYKRVLRGRRFDLFIDCHEDVDAPGLYVFARGGDLGRTIVEAVRAVGPIHPGNLVDGEIPLLDGVVNFGTRRRRPRIGPTRHLSGYISRFHQPDPQGRIPQPGARRAPALSYAAATVETPTSLSMRQRVKMHLTAIDAALATLTEK